MIIHRFDQFLRRVSWYFAIVSCGFLILIVLVTVADTGLRYLANAPIHGSNEIISLMLSFLIMTAIPLCTSERAHIQVDLLNNLLGTWGRRLSDIFTGIISIVVLSYLCWRSWRKAKEALEFGDATIFLDFPQWIIYGVICMSTIIFIAILLSQMALSLVGAEPDERH